MGSRLVICGVLGAGCVEHGSRPPTPFTLDVRDRTSATLLEQSFDDFALVAVGAPYVVTVAENGSTMEVTVPFELCEHLTHGCAGPLMLETLILTLDPIFEDHVLGSNCVGLDGTVSTGIDVTKTGACR